MIIKNSQKTHIRGGKKCKKKKKIQMRKKIVKKRGKYSLKILK